MKFEKPAGPRIVFLICRATVVPHQMSEISISLSVTRLYEELAKMLFLSSPGRPEEVSFIPVRLLTRLFRTSRKDERIARIPVAVRLFTIRLFKKDALEHWRRSSPNAD